MTRKRRRVVAPRVYRAERSRLRRNCAPDTFCRITYIFLATNRCAVSGRSFLNGV